MSAKANFFPASSRCSSMRIPAAGVPAAVSSTCVVSLPGMSFSFDKRADVAERFVGPDENVIVVLEPERLKVHRNAMLVRQVQVHVSNLRRRRERGLAHFVHRFLHRV